MLNMTNLIIFSVPCLPPRPSHTPPQQKPVDWRYKVAPVTRESREVVEVVVIDRHGTELQMLWKICHKWLSST